MPKPLKRAASHGQAEKQNEVKVSKAWSFDRTFSPASITGLAHLLAFVVAVTTFYNQVTNNQIHNDERFKVFAEQREMQNNQMLKLQETQNMMLVQFSGMTERINSQTDLLKDVRDTLKERKTP